MLEAIKYRKESFLGILEINDPPMNPLGVAQISALADLLPEITSDTSVRCVLVLGSGQQHFSVGANLKEGHLAVEEGIRQFSARRHQVFNDIEQLQKPVIAAIQGYCLGGGLELALACHLRVAAHSAQLGLPEIDLGAAPMWGGGQRIFRAIGRENGLDLLLTGRKVPADEALRLGLVQRCWSDEEFLDQSIKFAESISKKAPLAMAAMLRVAHLGPQMPWHDALEYELDQFSALGGTKDNIEGVTAKFEKREPRFIGE